jgi:hypothetical protein
MVGSVLLDRTLYSEYSSGTTASTSTPLPQQRCDTVRLNFYAPETIAAHGIGCVESTDERVHAHVDIV